MERNIGQVKISVDALKLKKDNPKRNLTKEHQYPRKKAAEELLNDKIDNIKQNGDLLFELYEDKYAMFNYVSSAENKAVSKHQKTKNFIDPEKAYKKAKIILVEITKEQLKKVKKGERKVIEGLLKKH